MDDVRRRSPIGHLPTLHVPLLAILLTIVVMTGNMYSQSVDDPPFISDTQYAQPPDDTIRRGPSGDDSSGSRADWRVGSHVYGLAAQSRLFPPITNVSSTTEGRTSGNTSRLAPTRVDTRAETTDKQQHHHQGTLVSPNASLPHPFPSAVSPDDNSPRLSPSFQPRTFQTQSTPPTQVSPSSQLGSPKSSTIDVVISSTVTSFPASKWPVQSSAEWNNRGALAERGMAMSTPVTTSTARWLTISRAVDEIPTARVAAGESDIRQSFRSVEDTGWSNVAAATSSTGSATSSLSDVVTPTVVAANGGGVARHLAENFGERQHDLESSAAPVRDEGSLGAQSPSSGMISASVTTSASGLVMTLSNSGSEGAILEPSMESHVRAEEHHMPAGTVAGIVIASIGFVALVSGVLGLVFFKKFRNLDSKTYDNKLSSDTCSYLDNLQVSYINSHIDIPKESSEEMFSLDNDSFLNSLEAMTMENYWAEDNRSTKV